MRIALAYAAVASAESMLSGDTPENLFADFIKKHNRQYTEEEGNYRFKIFRDNLRKIEEDNAKNLGYTLGITPFTDMTKDEFSNRFFDGLKGLKETDASREQSPKLTKEDIEKLPESVNWVADGAVTSVKNQGQCGSCWSFSAAGALEGAYAIATGELVDLSEQNLLDCDRYDSRCNGGWMDNAFIFAKKNGICSLESYPYECSSAYSWACRNSQQHPKCSACTKTIQPGEIRGYVDVKAESPEDMKAALAKGPVSVAIEADTGTFQLYKGGVLPAGQCGHQLDHGVLAVGYGEDDGKTYWTIKNSWSDSWGEGGYIRVQRSGAGVPAEGTCGILLAASYPVYKKSEEEVYF